MANAYSRSAKKIEGKKKEDSEEEEHDDIKSANAKTDLPLKDKSDLRKIKDFEYSRYLDILRECKRKYQFKKKKITYLISCSWLDSWLDYVDGEGPHPGPIDNRALWHSIFSKKEVKRKRDYYIIDQKVWEFLHGIYNGGPILHKEKKEVNLETVSVRSSVTSFEGTNIGNMVSDTVSQSDMGLVGRENSMTNKLGPDKDPMSAWNTSKKSSFISNLDVTETNSNIDVKNDQFFKGQSSYKPTSTFFDHTIAEVPHEEEAERPRKDVPEEAPEISPMDQGHANSSHAGEGESDLEEEEDEDEYEQEESENTLSNCEFNIIGLKNPGNYWYMNVCLQALLSVDELIEYYLKIDPNDLLRLAKASKKKDNVSYLFALFCHEALVEDRDDAYNPVMIQNSIKKIFSTQMQDTHEFFLYFFSKLQDEENKFKRALLAAKGVTIPKDPNPQSEKTAGAYWIKYKESHSSIIDKLFTGLMSTSVVRKCWSKITKNFEPFLDLSLEINSNSVNGWLNDFFADEKIGDQSEFVCEDCKVTTKAIIRKRIEKAPRNLIIHLKRFAYPSLKKDRSLIGYKHKLSVDKFLEKSKDNPVNQSIEYALYGMIIHKGKEMDRGHYICLFKREDKWYEFDDDKVYEIQGKENTKYVLDKEIYMLLYRREA